VSRISPNAAPAADAAWSAGAILAIDYGRARIGLALAESRESSPEPFATLERINRNEDMRRIREVVRDQGVKSIVVGLPLRLDGTRGEMAEEAERFARRVGKQIGVPVVMADERLTSWDAERELEEQFGRPRKPAGSASKQAKHKKAPARLSVDSMAAAIILRDYLGRKRAASGDSEGGPIG